MENKTVKPESIGNNIEQCCSNIPIYEIIYYEIQRKWLVCIYCMELDFFKTGIKEKVRIQA